MHNQDKLNQPTSKSSLFEKLSNTTMKYLLFLGLVLLFSIPFYVLDIFTPVSDLPFGLSINYLMRFVPFILAIIYSWPDSSQAGLFAMFHSIVDAKKAPVKAHVFGIFCLPMIGVLSYLTMHFLFIPLPVQPHLDFAKLPLMFVFYFLSAIPEEMGWTYVLAKPLSKTYGPLATGAMIGFVWAIWHVIPWGLVHSPSWVLGMSLLAIFIRTIMVYLYMDWGTSLSLNILFHTMFAITLNVFPNEGSHMNPWIFCIWTFITLLIVMFVSEQKRRWNERAKQDNQLDE